MGKFADDIEKDLLQGIEPAVNDFMLEVEARAKDLAPRGATGTLKDSIIATKAVMRAGQVFGVISAAAFSDRGFNYARYQHDVVLNHVSPQPLLQSFADFGLSGSPFQRYAQGYRALVGLFGRGGTSRYATKFLDKALDELSPKLDEALS